MPGVSWNKTELKILTESFKNGLSDLEIEQKLKDDNDCWNRSLFAIAGKRRTLGLVHFHSKVRCSDPFQVIVNNQIKAGFIK